MQTLAYIAVGGFILGVGAKLVQRPTEVPPGARRVACLGDSLTADGRYCKQLLAHLPEGSKVKAFGYAGQGTGYLLNKVEAVLRWGPTDLVVLGGVNDLPSRGASKAADNLARIYAEARGAGVRVVAVQVTPWHGYPSARGRELETRNLNSWIRHDALVDAWVDTGALGDEQYRLLGEYDSGDGLHLNSRGQQVLGGLIAAQGF